MPITSLSGLVLAIYNYSLEIVGLCVFVMFLYSGYLFMFGYADRAKAIMKDAAIGLILLFSSYVILNSINRGLVDLREPVVPSTNSGGGSVTNEPRFEPGGGNFGGAGATVTY